jgi:hypothetical protein
METCIILNMNGRQRFLATLSYQDKDRLPCLEEGIRDDVRLAWERQGLPPGADLAELFAYDIRQEIEFDLDPLPGTQKWPESMQELESFKRLLNPDDRRRIPKKALRSIPAWRERTFPLILRVQRGFFLSLGVENWRHFNRAIELTKDEPELVADILHLQGDLSARLVGRFLEKVTVDAALFSEPIGGNHGPLISPKMYRELVLPSFQPILDALRKYEVKIIIVRTYANPRPLIPLFLEAGINTLWAVEAPPAEMDYLQLRREFGKELRLIGGIDTDALHTGRQAIQKAVRRLAPLVADGGFIPLLDGRVREEVSFADYMYYRKLLVEIAT